jgi:hypothetical protein
VINRVALTCGLVLIDVCWLYPWAFLVGLWTSPDADRALLSAPALLALLLLAALSTHLLGRAGRRNPRLARIALAVIALIAATIVVRFEHYGDVQGLDWLSRLAGALAATIGQLSLPVLGFALALYVWWRGVRLGSQTPGFADVEGSFRWGIGRLAVFGLIVGVTSRPGLLPTVQATTTPYIVGFFFVSLLTLALGRLESLRTRTRTPSLNPQWLGVLVAVAAAVVLLSLLVAQLVSFDLLLVATRPLFDLLGQVVLLALYAIVIPLAFVIQWIIYLVLSLMRANGNQPPPRLAQPADVDNRIQQLFAQQLSPELIAALKAAGAGVLVIIALVIVARGLARWRPSAADADATNEERDSLWNARNARALLLAWLRRLLRRNRPEAPTVASSGPLEESAAASVALTSVRELYAELLRRGEAVGTVRAPSTTPFEHAPALSTTLDPEDAIAQLTEAYVHARYADDELSGTEQLAERLEQVRAKDAAQ